jgi:hypothetical protein
MDEPARKIGEDPAQTDSYQRPKLVDKQNPAGYRFMMYDCHIIEQGHFF